MLDILAVLPISNECKQLFSSYKIPLDNQHSQLQIDIIKANKVLWHAYRPPPKGTFDNKEVDNLVERVSLKEAAKAQLTAAVATEASAQVKDNIINEEEGELNKQYTAIKIDYKTKVIGEE